MGIYDVRSVPFYWGSLLAGFGQLEIVLVRGILTNLFGLLLSPLVAAPEPGLHSPPVAQLASELLARFGV